MNKDNLPINTGDGLGDTRNQQAKARMTGRLHLGQDFTTRSCLINILVALLVLGVIFILMWITQEMGCLIKSGL
jgi:hypothetical protein